MPRGCGDLHASDIGEGEEGIMNGVYQSFGDIRKAALELAIESGSMHSEESLSTEAVIARAESYFLFLMDDA
jgi:hypothetical protein